MARALARVRKSSRGEVEGAAGDIPVRLLRFFIRIDYPCSVLVGSSTVQRDAMSLNHQQELSAPNCGLHRDKQERDHRTLSLARSLGSCLPSDSQHGLLHQYCVR